MNDVLVVGAGGYIGRHVVRALLDRGHQVTATARPGSRRDIDPRATVVDADVLSPDFDVHTLAAAAPAAVVHLAWQDGFAHNAPSHLRQLSRHFALLEAFADWGVGSLSVLGSMHEVGYWEGAITADSPTNPLTLYGIAKDALRRATLTGIAPKVPVQWLRCYYIYGDDRNNQSIFTKLLDAVDRGQSTFPFTSGLNRYDFIDVEELGRQIAVLTAHPEETGVINCATGNPQRLRDVVEAFIADRGLPIALEYGAFPDRPYDSPGVWGDATRIQQILTADARA